MNFADLLIDGFGRVRDSVHGAVRNLNAGQLAERLAPEANSVAWLVWHLTRVQDDHFAELQDTEQVWLSQGWYEKFGLPLEPADTGYGHSAHDVASVRVSAKLLTDYHDAVHAQTIAWLRGLKETELDRIVDESWDPPVSLGVRVISVLDDDLEHVGQAAFVRGIIRRR